MAQQHNDMETKFQSEIAELRPKEEELKVCIVYLCITVEPVHNGYFGATQESGSCILGTPIFLFLFFFVEAGGTTYIFLKKFLL